MNSNLDVINKELGVFSVILAILGTAFNLLTFSVCMRKRLRETPTFIFLAFMVINDTYSLYFYNLNSFATSFFKTLLQEISLEFCKFVNLSQFISNQSSAFLLVTMCIERYLSIKITNWRKVYFNSKKATILSAAIVVFFFLFNIHLASTLYIPKSITNGTVVFGSCLSLSELKFWRMVKFFPFFYKSVLPF